MQQAVCLSITHCDSWTGHGVRCWLRGQIALACRFGWNTSRHTCSAIHVPRMPRPFEIRLPAGHFEAGSGREASDCWLALRSMTMSCLADRGSPDQASMKRAKSASIGAGLRGLAATNRVADD